MGGAIGLQFLPPATRREPAAILARRMVQVALAQAEELSPAEPNTSLGTCLARAQETAAVAARETMTAIESGQILAEPETAGNIAAAFVDLCAESLRAAGHLLPGSTDPREDVLTAIERQEREGAYPDWDGILKALASIQAALEPVTKALHRGDAQMDLAGTNPGIPDSLVAVAGLSYGVVYGLCQERIATDIRALGSS